MNAKSSSLEFHLLKRQSSNGTAQPTKLDHRLLNRTSLLVSLLLFLPLFSLSMNTLQPAFASSANSAQRNSYEDSVGGTSSPNTTYITQILNRLTDRSRYDKRLRPNLGQAAVDVGITMHVTSISAVSEVDMDFTLDLYMRQTWQDSRLAFHQMDTAGFEKIKHLTVGIEYLDKLWKPDTFFPNEKKSYFHLATTHNSFLRIEPDGTLFPMDTQLCKLEVESYGYTTEDIDMYWGKKKDDGKPAESAVAFDPLSLPQFRLTGYRVNITRATTSSGSYIRLNVQVIMSRNLGFYLMNIVIPAVLVTSISWVSFWLSREASPARVGLGVTTVLTMTTLITTTNNSMPKVSYIKGLDVFLNFCFIMVFSSLVEYAVVSYWNKRQSRRRDRRKRPAVGNAATAEMPPSQPSVGEFPMFMNCPTTPAGGLTVPSHPSVQSYLYRPPGILTPAAQTVQSSQQQQTTTLNSVGANIAPDCDCRTIPLMCMEGDGGAVPFQTFQHPHLGPSNSIPSYSFMASGGSKFSTRRRSRRPYSYYGSYNNSSFLSCCRIRFPVIFIVFNIFYWFAMTTASQYRIQSMNYVPF